MTETSNCENAKSGTRAIPVLVIKGASNAIEHYKKAFGAEEKYRMNYPQSDKIVHACISIGSTDFFITEENVEMKAVSTPGQGFYIYVPNVDEVMKKAVAAGLKEVEPAKDMFWGDRTGSVTDPYGLKWSIATHVRDVSPQEIEEAMKKNMGKAA